MTHHELPSPRRRGPRGAYASSLAARYNGRPRPAEVFIHPSGDIKFARARERVS